MPRLSVESAFIEEFINVYKHNECLWQIKNRDYHNHEVRDAGYEQLRLVIFRHFGERLAKKEYVLKKIRNLRTAYKKELRKVKRSRQFGSDRVHVPKLWYYSQLSFWIMKTDHIDENPMLLELDENHETNRAGSSASNFSNIDPISLGESETIRKRNRTRRYDSVSWNDVKEHKHDVLNKLDDEFDIAGKDYAAKLRKLETDQRFIVEKVVADIIFQARLRRLKPNSSIWTPTD
ncbi:hypothetical protein MML48_4g00009797 [Holotrichia oblita]|uniref:Uncharacterized protein n=2 Tax=Holotrichia oblita TaxID=644536 RepID=A0ACB9TA97_HOLOL|nr:hypothetical protein MML48_4g00020538 [Holotrichia oblita]KAI4463697.1 hypothetical protein MML48_4g00009797 [Holotrichia oblita]